MIVLGVDPGLTATGAALFDNGEWRTCTIRPKGSDLVARIEEIIVSLKGFVRRGAGYGIPLDLLVVERMFAYPGRKVVAQPNDLIKLAMLGGAVIGAIPHELAAAPTPKVWKGGVPKDIHHKRLRQRIGFRLEACSKDAMDAVGLALWGLDLLDKL